MAHHHHHHGPNSIVIHLNKGSYVGGETIYGHVFLNICQPTPAKGLCLELRGREKVFWEYEKSESYTDPQDNQVKFRTIVCDHNDERHFFKDSFRLIDHPGGFPVGCFSYPFQYRLPADLPGIFKKTKKRGLRYKSKVQYTIKAILDIPHTKHDLVTKQHLVIHSRLHQAVQPKHEIKTAQVMTLCCIPRGNVSVEAWIDKNCYISGEVANIHVRVKNDSSVNVDHFNSKLVREIVFSDHHGHKKYETEIISEARYEGCPAMDFRERSVPLHLRSRKQKLLQASTRSSFVQCTYKLLIEMDIPWAPDIVVPSPITIYSPQNQEWVSFVPPSWASQCVVVNVTDPNLQVPLEILNQTVQNGIFVAPANSQLPFPEFNVTIHGNAEPVLKPGQHAERQPLLH